MIIGIILNLICYLIIFICFSWDKLYYIITKNGNNSNLYFIYVVHNKCFVHNSYTCGCHLELRDEDNSFIIKKFVLLYKVCSNPFIKYNKKRKSQGDLISEILNDDHIY